MGFFDNFNANALWVKIVAVILVIIIGAISLLISYKLFLHLLIGKWVDPLLCKLGWFGKFFIGDSKNCPEGMVGLLNNISSARMDILASRPATGVRTTRGMGYGNACVWTRGYQGCNPWDKLKVFGANDDDISEERRIEEENEVRSGIYQSLQDPARRKVLLNISQNQLPTSLSTLYGGQFNLKTGIQNLTKEGFKGYGNHKINTVKNKKFF